RWWRHGRLQPARLTLAAHRDELSRPAGGIAARTLLRLWAFPAQGLPRMLGRLGQLALLGERQAPVGVGLGEVGLDAQGLLEVLDRLGRPALTIEHVSEVVVSEGRVGFNRKRMGPQPLLVMPDLDLVPSEDSQRDDDPRGNAGKPPRRGATC